MTKRLTWLVWLLGVGCVFTPRPMIPLEESDAGGSSLTNGGGDAGQQPERDAATGAAADGATDYFGDAAAPSPNDSACHRAGDAGDAGYIDEGGAPCDPRASGDGGAGDASDAACDGGDATARPGTDAACHDDAHGVARGRR